MAAIEAAVANTVAGAIDQRCFQQCTREGDTEGECRGRCRRQLDSDELFVAGAAKSGLKDWKIGQEAARLTKDVKRVNAHFQGATEAVRAGHVAEDYHRATYNVDAIKKGISTCAIDTPCHSPQDLSVGRTEVQIKYGEAHNLKKLNGAKYDGMQKIVPEGRASSAKGWSDHIDVNGAKSTPLSNEGAHKLVCDTASSVEQAIPTDSVGMSALKTGTWSALGGGTFAGVVSGAAAAWSGAGRDEVARSAGESALQGAVSSGLSSATADAIVNSSGHAVAGVVGGGMVSGLVGTGFSMRQCSRRFEKEEDRSACRGNEASKGAAGTAAAAGATLLCSTFLGPFGTVCGMAASMGVRSAWGRKEG